jgi:hypothetical protein
MFDLKWSAAEKKVARAAYDAALNASLQSIMTEFKQRAAAVTSASQMWELEDYLREARREIDSMFIYSYSRLPLTFAWAVRSGRLDEAALAGLSQDKLKLIFSMARD